MRLKQNVRRALDYEYQLSERQSIKRTLKRWRHTHTHTHTHTIYCWQLSTVLWTNTIGKLPYNTIYNMIFVYWGLTERKLNNEWLLVNRLG